jgi:MHS family proline/betaine transporter-like MFS transporter
VFFAWVGLCLLAAGVVLCVVVTTALLSEMFPTRNRYTASAVTYNVAYAVFGGTAPLVSAFLIQHTGERIAGDLFDGDRPAGNRCRFESS